MAKQICSEQTEMISNYDPTNPFDKYIHETSHNNKDSRQKWREQFQSKYVRLNDLNLQYMPLNKKSNNGNSKSNNSLHICKVGCPKHELLPILKRLQYPINDCLCSKRSFLCDNIDLDQYHMVTQLSMNKFGLNFKGSGGFSKKPVEIRLIDKISKRTIYCNNIFVSLLGDTSLDKRVRPGMLLTYIMLLRYILIYMN